MGSIPVGAIDFFFVPRLQNLYHTQKLFTRNKPLRSVIELLQQPLKKALVLGGITASYLNLGRLVAISAKDTSVIRGQFASTRVVISGQ